MTTSEPAADGHTTIPSPPPPSSKGLPPNHRISFILTGDFLTLDEVKEAYIHYVLEATNQNRTHAAKILDIDRKTLYRKAPSHG
jgi:DNA-binding NtrC family response regulator